MKYHKTTLLGVLGIVTSLAVAVDQHNVVFDSPIKSAVGSMPTGAQAERAAHCEEALARAKATGKDIVVLQRGSDWNRLGEMLYEDIWLKDEFARALGDGFILVAVDLPEEEGGRALRGPYSPKLDGRSGVQADDSPPLRLAKLTEDQAPLPADEVMAVKTQSGVTFKRRDDGAWLAGGDNPAQDTLTLKMKTTGGGQVLRLDFPTDPSLPGNGPGRASNGNFVVSEAEAESGRNAIKLVAAWASAFEGSWGAWQAIDGISDKGDNLWNAAGHHHRRRTLLLTMGEPVPAGAELTVRLICRSQWGQHVPGCVRAAVLRAPALADDIARVAGAQGLKSKNRKFSWWDTTYCPRVALMDSEGRAVACENKPRLGLTPATLAARVKELRAVREKRDALWAKAEAAQGPQKAELLRQSLELLGFANWAGNENCYKFIHDKIRAADPKDESGVVRWLGFGGDPRDGVPWTEPSWGKALEKKDLTDADYEEALARIDKELKDPRNRVLDHERIQRIMIAKYHVYARWPKHEEQRFDVQREIAAFDSDTFWGIGAIGDLGLRHRSAVPMLTYGWGARQVKPGLNCWDMTDTACFFDHAGSYKFRMTCAGGKDALKIRRIALLDGATVLSEAKPAADLGPGRGSVEVDLDLKDWRADRKLVLRVEAEAAEGHTDISGSFGVEPQLPPAPAVAKRPTATDEVSRMLARGEIHAMQQKLGDHLMTEASQGSAGMGRVVDSPALRASMAQYTVIRLCGGEKVEDVATREGGAAFLVGFFKDTDWMESFLASDKADWPQALENLYVLSRYGAGLEQPLNQRLATALALQWDKGSRYRLVDRFGHVQWALRDGLMHISFEGLDVRGMRWAVPTYGTARDFQFLLDDRQTRLRDYLGAHGGVRYVSYNVYGVSVQDQWNYIAPWTHVHGTGTGNRPFPAHRRVGGVCGTVSTYGSATAQAHGIPSAAIGQPGHCAYIVRVGQEWPVGNSATWPSYASAPGWDGTGYSTLHRLYEPVNQDRERFMAATRLSWLAQLQADRVKAHVRILPGLRYRLYRQEVGAALPDFSKLTPHRSETCGTIDLSAVQPVPPENFAVVWEGQIEATGKGPLRVSTQSDDSSRVLLDGQPIVATTCSRQENEISIGAASSPGPGTTKAASDQRLTPGRHDLRVEFSQGGGQLSLKVGFEGVLPAAATDWTRTYEQAILSQPTNYSIWLEYIKTLEAVKDVPADTWLDLGRRAARSLAVCNEAGWALTMRCLDKVLPGMQPAQRVEVLVACNRDLRQENWVKPEAFPYDGILNWQADRIADPALAVKLFGRLLAIHHSPKPDNNWIFGNVLSWGQRRFAGNPATAPACAKVMEAFFESQGDAVNKDLLAATVASGIRKASEGGDIVSYRLWSNMAEKMLPPLTPQDVHLNAAQAAAVPKYQPFPGELLSKEGMLQTSSACGHDRPLSYAQVLSGGFGGYFETNNEEKPWAQVQLRGEATLAGIVLVNRYERAPTEGEFQWAVPLKVCVSLDGKTWTEVAVFDKADTVFCANLQGKGIKARFVRIERLPGTDKTKPPGRFHFRNFLVYGWKRY